MKFLWIALGGALGSIMRYLLGGLVQRASGGIFPWGTLAVNMLGCFLFGLVWSVAEERVAVSGTVRILTLVGFMGAFTTFSTFVFETGQLIRDSELALALGNIALQNILGTVFLFAGLFLGKTV